MKYQKPDLNELGCTENLVLGHIPPRHLDNPNSSTGSAFEFEE
jgi:hypothetical protein